MWIEHLEPNLDRSVSTTCTNHYGKWTNHLLRRRFSDTDFFARIRQHLVYRSNFCVDCGDKFRNLFGYLYEWRRLFIYFYIDGSDGKRESIYTDDFCERSNDLLCRIFCEPDFLTRIG